MVVQSVERSVGEKVSFLVDS
jgi:hypothetical protein